MKTKTTILIVSVVTLSLLGGCKQGKKATTWKPPADQFAFVEYYITYDGKPLEGNPPPGMRIDGPTYIFNSENGEIDSYMESNFSMDTISTVVGVGRIRRGTEGGGLSSRLVGVTNLPFSDANFTIDGFTSESMLFQFKDENFSLKVGEEWQKVFESIDTIPCINGENAIVQREIVHQISYRGVFPKDNIKFAGN